MKLYNDYSSYLKERYGVKVYKIGIDAGFSCPSICIYCNDKGSRSSYTNARDPIDKQLSERIEYLKKNNNAAKFIAYFQSFTNTNAPACELKRAYDCILPFKDVVGLSIGTRPDCVDRDKLSLIASYKDDYDVWIEYGLQSIHNKTLKTIKRGHNFEDFLRALEDTKALSISVCAHVIIGLPGETREEIIDTAKKLTELKINGVKIHLLHILRESGLEKPYRDGSIKILSQDEYAELVCDFLEHLSGDIIIQRLTGQGSREDHIAPLWALDKIGTINRIEETLRKRGSYQGINS